MPLIPSQYHPPPLYRNGHFSTIHAGLFRKVEAPPQHRERLLLEDGDFLDLDWSHSGGPTRKLVLLLHGLEGDAQRPYITGSAKLLTQNGHDCCAINLRGCSGEPNLLFRSYHSGASQDLAEVLGHLLATTPYDRIFLKGFSLGGNLVLKYLGEGRKIPKQIKGAMAVSVPCDLKGSSEQLHRIGNFPYHHRFKKHLLAKLRQKQALFPDLLSAGDLGSIKSLRDFDEIYTSRAHRFRDALDYYEKCSSLPLLPLIEVPTLIVNAGNDSFLGPGSYPLEAAKNNPRLHLEIPAYGGHVGFWGRNNVTYTEKRALEFFKSLQSAGGNGIFDLQNKKNKDG